MSASFRSALVSVVVTSYNHAQFMASRMESLLNQTYQSIEILVIDDCSTENNVEILRGYESHPKVRLLINSENRGLVPTINQGIEMTLGEFVIIAQCDDSCDPRMIEKLVGVLEQHPKAGMAFCRSQLIDEFDQLLGDDFLIRERSFRSRCVTNTLLSSAEMNRFLLNSCVIPNMSALLIRRDCLAVVGKLSDEYSVCVDWDLYFRVVERYDVAYVAEPLNKFRQHKNSIRRTIKDRVIHEEYFRLLLGKIRAIDLTLVESCRFRTRVMYLWALHLISPSWAGLVNLPYHCRIVVRYDAPALLFFWLGLAIRAAEVMVKLLSFRKWADLAIVAVTTDNSLRPKSK
jgi:glycosyltransferase involved in cell wall biosynthesis